MAERWSRVISGDKFDQPRAMQFAVNAANFILDAKGIRTAETVCINSRGSQALTGAVVKQVMFSYASIQLTFSIGFPEYETVKWVWGWTSYDGYRGVWQEVLHEVAHVMMPTGVHHTGRYQEALSDLVREFPFERLSFLLSEPVSDKFLRLCNPALKAPAEAKTRRAPAVKKNAAAAFIR